MTKPRFLRSNYLYLSGLIVLAAGMPLSLFLMSISQFILAASFFIEGNFFEKLRRFRTNNAAVLVAGIWLMHVVGLLWTTDVAQGWNDIRIKLPLLILTVIIAGTTPISRKEFLLVLGCFIAAVFAGTMVSTFVLLFNHNIVDIRDVFIFKISHIRFALFTCVSAFSLLYFIFSKKENIAVKWKILLGILSVWFFVFLFVVESLTGLAIGTAVLAVLLITVAWRKQSSAVRIVLVSSAIALVAIVVFFLYDIFREFESERLVSIDLNARTEQGNPYTFNLDNPEMENGYPAYIYMCDEELRRCWNRRSAISFDSLDNRMQPVKYTLIRFLASKGLRKDSAAMIQLSDAEIHSIENGIPNINYQTHSVKSRLLELAWEFDQYSKGGDPNGHSVLQRLESWKAATGVIKANLFFGVGTGDLPAAMRTEYSVMHSQLNERHYLRCHNQYLAIGVAFGICGLIYFMFVLFYPFITKQKLNYFYVMFFLIALLSMLTEDTLETQPGATFFAFFNAFFLFAKPKDL